MANLQTTNMVQVRVPLNNTLDSLALDPFVHITHKFTKLQDSTRCLKYDMHMNIDVPAVNIHLAWVISVT